MCAAGLCTECVVKGGAHFREREVCSNGATHGTGWDVRGGAVHGTGGLGGGGKCARRDRARNERAGAPWGRVWNGRGSSRAGRARNGGVDGGREKYAATKPHTEGAEKSTAGPCTELEVQARGGVAHRSGGTWAAGPNTRRRVNQGREKYAATEPHRERARKGEADPNTQRGGADVAGPRVKRGERSTAGPRAKRR